MLYKRPKPWTKEQYLHWRKTRSADAADWVGADCYAADAYVKAVSLKAFKEWLASNVKNKALRDWNYLLASAHFGSVDVDELFIALNIYPDHIKGWDRRPYLANSCKPWRITHGKTLDENVSRVWVQA